MQPLLAHINVVGTKLFSPKPWRKVTRPAVVKKQLFFDPKLAQTTRSL